MVEGRPASVRCLIHPGRLLRRTRRQILQPRKLVLDGLMFSLQLPQSTAELLILCPQTPTSPINSRTTPIRSACVRRSSESGTPVVIPSLNHIFEPLTPPPARKFAPVTKIPIKFLILLRCRLRDSNPRPRDYKSDGPGSGRIRAGRKSLI